MHRPTTPARSPSSASVSTYLLYRSWAVRLPALAPRFKTIPRALLYSGWAGPHPGGTCAASAGLPPHLAGLLALRAAYARHGSMSAPHSPYAHGPPSSAGSHGLDEGPALGIPVTMLPSPPLAPPGWDGLPAPPAPYAGSAAALADSAAASMSGAGSGLEARVSRLDGSPQHMASASQAAQRVPLKRRSRSQQGSPLGRPDTPLSETSSEGAGEERGGEGEGAGEERCGGARLGRDSAPEEAGGGCVAQMPTLSGGVPERVGRGRDGPARPTHAGQADEEDAAQGEGEEAGRVHSVGSEGEGGGHDARGGTDAAAEPRARPRKPARVTARRVSAQPVLTGAAGLVDWITQTEHLGYSASEATQGPSGLVARSNPLFGPASVPAEPSRLGTAAPARGYGPSPAARHRGGAAHGTASPLRPRDGPAAYAPGLEARWQPALASSYGLARPIPGGGAGGLHGSFLVPSTRRRAALAAASGSSLLLGSSGGGAPERPPALSQVAGLRTASATGMPAAFLAEVMRRQETVSRWPLRPPPVRLPVL
jgi:hypothetical protein